ncbi:MAG: hypothetical protein RJA98_2557 [Pseudomonadota bacterium]|jgi:Lon protease-like protein
MPADRSADTGAMTALPLFPLRSVLFPGGLLGLKVFEARYLDLIGNCLRQQRPFGVVALRQGGEVRADASEAVVLESAGTLAELMDVDSTQPGILQVRCRGTQRFAIGRSWQAADGLWMAEAQRLPADPTLPPEPDVQACARALGEAIEALKGQGAEPFLVPHMLDDASWVANRWCEILPIAAAAKQQLMMLNDPMARLRLVDRFLREQGVIG